MEDNIQIGQPTATTELEGYNVTAIQIEWEPPTPVVEEDVFFLMENGETFQFVDPETGEVIVETPKLDVTEFSDMELEALKFDRQYYYHKIKEVGLQAQYDAELKALNEKYLPQLKRAQSSQNWLVLCYQKLLQAYIMNKLSQENGQSKRPKKTTFIGRIKAGFRTNPDKTVIVDSGLAVGWLKAAIAADTQYTEDLKKALKVEERVLTSHIPDEVKLKLTEKSAQQTGLVYHPPAEVFKIDVS
jgi:hypothetical protein